MKRKPFSPMRFFSVLVWISAIMTGSFFQTGCNSDKDKTALVAESTLAKPEKTPEKVLMALNIKFKPNVNGEMRDITIRAIKKILMDSVMSMSKNAGEDHYVTFYEMSSNKDSSTVGIMAKTPSPAVAASLGDTTKCNCTKNCGICLKLLTTANLPGPGPSPLQHILQISDMKDDGNF